MQIQKPEKTNFQQCRQIETHSALTGATALTRTPEAAHSMARVFVKLSTAALAAPVWLAMKGWIEFKQTDPEHVS